MALARRRPASLLPLLAALLYAATFLAVPAAVTGNTVNEAVLWGRNKNEGSLREACDSGRYAMATIFFLDVPSHGRCHLDLSGHNISAVGADIKHCQSKNILVSLSIGGFGRQNSLPTPKSSAADVADYIWNAFIHGTQRGVHRPFGDAYVNGIDFDAAWPDSYDELVRRLRNYDKAYRARTPAAAGLRLGCSFFEGNPEDTLLAGTTCSAKLAQLIDRLLKESEPVEVKSSHEEIRDVQ